MRNALVTDSAAQTASSTPGRLDDFSILLSNPFDFSQGENADRVGHAQSEDLLDTWAAPIECRSNEPSEVVELGFRHNSGEVGTVVQHSPLEDRPGRALWEAFRGEESIAVPATGIHTPLPQDFETDGPNPPSHFPGPPLASLDNDVATGDESPRANHARAQQSQLIDEPEQSSASPVALGSRPLSHDGTSGAGCDTFANTTISEGSVNGQWHPSHSAESTDVANIENSDSDGPPLTSRRRRILPRTRDSHIPSPSPTPRSSADSIDVGSAIASRRYKRFKRRKCIRRKSSTPDADDSTASSIMSRSTGKGEGRPIQCLVQRKMNGSQEVITIQLPVFDLCTGAGPVFTLSPSGETSRTPPSRGVVRKSGTSRRRTRFTREEEDLLVELKEKKDPRLSWREIQRHFPHRSVGSLQVHYSTHLKKRGRLRRSAV